MNAADAFRLAVESGDIDAVPALLAEDVVFHSPATFHPFVGRDTVARLLACVADTFEDFRYTDELDAASAPQGDGVHALIFRASVGGRELEGIDLLRLDADGKIADFTVMVRPLSGLIPLAQAMGEKLAAAGIVVTRS